MVAANNWQRCAMINATSELYKCGGHVNLESVNGVSMHNAGFSPPSMLTSEYI